MAKFYEKNNLNLGIGLGLLLPMVVYGIIWALYSMLQSEGRLHTNISEAFRERTIALLAIAADIILVQYYRKRRRWSATLRGVLVAMGALCLLWMVYYLPGLFR